MAPALPDLTKFIPNLLNARVTSHAIARSTNGDGDERGDASWTEWFAFKDLDASVKPVADIWCGNAERSRKVSVRSVSVPRRLAELDDADVAVSWELSEDRKRVRFLVPVLPPGQVALPRSIFEQATRVSAKVTALEPQTWIQDLAAVDEDALVAAFRNARFYGDDEGAVFDRHEIHVESGEDDVTLQTREGEDELFELKERKERKKPQESHVATAAQLRKNLQQRISSELPPLINASTLGIPVTLCLGVADNGTEVGITPGDILDESVESWDDIKFRVPPLFPPITHAENLRIIKRPSRDALNKVLLKVSATPSQALSHVRIVDWSVQRRHARAGTGRVSQLELGVTPLDVRHVVAAPPALVLANLRSASAFTVLFDPRGLSSTVLDGVSRFREVVSTKNEVDALGVACRRGLGFRHGEKKLAVVFPDVVGAHGHDGLDLWDHFRRLWSPSDVGADAGDDWDVVLALPRGIPSNVVSSWVRRVEDPRLPRNARVVWLAPGRKPAVPENDGAGAVQQPPNTSLVCAIDVRALVATLPKANEMDVEDVRRRAESWMQNPHECLLGWDVVHAREPQYVARTSITTALVKAVRTALVSDAGLKVVQVSAELPQAGLTALLMCAAHDLAEEESTCTLWVERAPSEADQMPLAELLRDSGRAVVLVDTFSCVDDVKLWVERALSLSHGSRAVLVAAVADRIKAHITVPACWREVDDRILLRACVCAAVSTHRKPDAQRATNDALRKMAEYKEEPYLCVLVLAAFQGAYKPALDLVREDKRNLIEVVSELDEIGMRLLAMLAAFCRDPEVQALPIASARVAVQRGQLKLLKLVPSKLDLDNGEVRFLHPYYARVWLLNEANEPKLARTVWPPFPEPGTLKEFWSQSSEQLVRVLKSGRPQVERRVTVVRAVLNDRAPGARLSSLCEWLVRYHLDAFPSEETRKHRLEQDLKSLFGEPKRDPLNEIHAMVAKSRVFRYAKLYTAGTDVAREAHRKAESAHRRNSTLETRTDLATAQSNLGSMLYKEALWKSKSKAPEGERGAEALALAREAAGLLRPLVRNRIAKGEFERLVRDFPGLDVDCVSGAASSTSSEKETAAAELRDDAVLVERDEDEDVVVTMVVVGEQGPKAKALLSWW